MNSPNKSATISVADFLFLPFFQTPLIPNSRYYTSASTDQQTIDIYIIDSFGRIQQLTLSFNNDSEER